MESIKPSQLKIVLRDLIEINLKVSDKKKSLSPMIWGSPGIGKSEIMAQVALETDRELIDLRLSTLDEVDLRGLPSIQDGVSIFNPTGLLPREGINADLGVLFIDELTVAPPSMQGAIYQLILDRRVGDYRLPDGWITAGAGNLDTDGAISNRMSSALANRVVHYQLEVDAEDWQHHALGSGVRPEILAFLRFRPELLMKFGPQDKAQPTPRSWSFVSTLLDQQSDPVIRRIHCSGAIGIETCAELMAFLSVWEGLPDIDEILDTGESSTWGLGAGGENFQLREPSVIYALMGCLAHEANPQNFENVVKYIEGHIGEEFQVVCIRDAIRRNPNLETTRPYVDWAIRHKEIHL